MGGGLATLVRNAAATRGDHTGLVSGERRLTWAQVDAAVDAVAAGLADHGCGPGDRVALALGNSIEAVTGYFGALRAGCVAVPVTAGATAPEVATLLADCEAVAVLADRSALDAVRAAAATASPAPLVVVVGAPAAREVSLGSFAGAHRPVDIPPAQLAVLAYTAGTAGRPRGAMLTHASLGANVEQVAALAHPAMTAEDVVLLVLPLSQLYALNGTLAQAARVGATVVLADVFDPVATLALLAEQRVSVVPGVPSMFAAWAARPELGTAMAGVRLLLTGGAPMPVAVARRVGAATGLALHQGYGLTEAGPGVTSTLVGGVAKPGSVGRPLPGVAVRLVDADGDDVDEGDPGEIWVRGPNLFAGYWPDAADGPRADGWFATGDVAVLDEDGDLALVDRRTDLVLVHGFNVYPREVEQVLLTHPGVAEAAVVGVPDPTSGEAVRAYVVAAPGARLVGRDVADYAAARLARFKRPASVVVVDHLPHSATGEVAKGVLRGQG